MPLGAVLLLTPCWVPVGILLVMTRDPQHYTADQALLTSHRALCARDAFVLSPKSCSNAKGEHSMIERLKGLECPGSKLQCKEPPYGLCSSLHLRHFRELCSC